MTHRLLFLGTPDFAVPSLKALAADTRFEIVGVVTQPDKPVGRNAVMTPPPIKTAAQELGIQVIKQPEKLTDAEFRTWIEEIGPTCDAFVVVAYGKIFRDWFLVLPKHGLINIHASLLPRWRGASPINAAIAAGDAKSGVSIMKIEAEMDAGPVYAAAETPIHPDDTAETLHDRLAQLGADLIPNVVANVVSKNAQAIEQDASLATFCKTLTREDGNINWNLPAEQISLLIRAYHPWPGTWTTVNEKRLKIFKAVPLMADEMRAPGMRFTMGQGRPAIGCGEGSALELLQVQPEGGKIMSGEEYLRGVKVWES